MNLLLRLVVHLFALLRYLALPRCCPVRSAPTAGIKPVQVSFNRSWTGMLTALAVMLSFIAVAPAHAAPGPRFAKPAGVATGTCDSWANACDLQRALTIAQEIPVSTVWVMKGTHTPTTTNSDPHTATFQLSIGVSVYGGFVGTETDLSQRNPTKHVTILSGEIGVAGLSDNAYHVVTGADGASLDGFTVTAGNAGGTRPDGGGIFHTSGALTISNCIFSGNAATYGSGIANLATLTVLNSIFSSNSAYQGGGIYNNSGTLTVLNSTFSGNSASRGGGGIYNNSTLTLSNSTFSGNSAHDGGGGIYNDDVTSSIPNHGTLTLSNISFSGNVATLGYGGGLFMKGGSAANITNSTFSGNDGGTLSTAAGIYNAYSRPVTLRNTIMANSTSGANCVGTITNGGNNIDDGSSCGWGAASGSMSGTNPLLGALANNGGPTQTFALLTGSPAINGVTFNAPNGAPATDQRGVARPQGVRYDIGAYETTRQVGANFVVNTNTDTDDGACETVPAGDCTLREAINAANALAGANTITFSVSGTISLGSTLPIITDTAGLTIDGIGQKVIISGNNAVRVSVIYAGGSLALNDLTIANGNSVAGGGVYNMGTLTVTNSTFSGNSAQGGGGIYNEGTLNITNSAFSGNNALGGSNGGGIFTLDGTVIITNSTFSGNTSGWSWGGGVYMLGYYGGTLTITNCTFSDNSAPGNGGGGIGNNGIGTTTLYNTIVTNNTGGNCSGTITNGGNNIDDGTSCGWGAASGSKSGTNPMLGALANNGGPTQTFALLPGSPAINGVTFNAPNGAPATDQRGVARPRGARYDIGAYERNAPDLTPILMLLLD